MDVAGEQAMLSERFQVEQRGPVVIVNIEAGDLTSLEVDELLAPNKA